MKPRTPEELAKDKDRDKYTLYLNVDNMSEVQARAGKANTSASKLVDEAIAYYLSALKSKKSE